MPPFSDDEYGRYRGKKENFKAERLNSRIGKRHMPEFQSQPQESEGFQKHQEAQDDRDFDKSRDLPSIG